MTVELDKSELITLIIANDPRDYKLDITFQMIEFGKVDVNAWQWNVINLNKCDEYHLWQLYQMFKRSKTP